jgi:hypothetical protein
MAAQITISSRSMGVITRRRRDTPGRASRVFGRSSIPESIPLCPRACVGPHQSFSIGRPEKDMEEVRRDRSRAGGLGLGRRPPRRPIAQRASYLLVGRPRQSGIGTRLARQRGTDALLCVYVFLT